MRRALTTLTLALTIATAVACGSTSSTTVAGPSPAKCQLTATNSTPSFKSTGGSGSITVAAARECTWSAAAQVNWVALTPPTDGQGDATLKYTVQTNASGLPRSGSVNVGGQLVAVGQEGATCRFDLERTKVQVAAEAATFDLAVQGPAGCAWTATSEADWLVVSQGAQGSGPGRVAFRVSANAGRERRGTAVVAGVRVEVAQGAVGGSLPPSSPPPPPSPDCTFSVSPNGPISVGAAGETGAIDVATAGGCAWTAASPDNWIQLGATGGSGDGRVSYVIAANTATADRTGTITIAGTRLTVTQSGASLPPAAITLSGSVAGLAGACPVTTFRVDDRTVTTSAATGFKGGNCGKLEDGVDVIVRGRLDASGRVDANEVEFDDDNSGHDGGDDDDDG